jgi:uncharacterized surface protein with fasciclin (FAS1) repeats
MIKTYRRALLAFGGMAAAGTLFAPAVLRAQTRSIADTLAGDSRFSMFLDLITRASMVDQFREPGPMTVFAPVDAAFTGAPAQFLQEMSGRSEQGNNKSSVDPRLSALINYHVVPGAFTSDELMGTDRRLRTLNGSDISFTSSGGQGTVRNPAPAQQIAGFGAAGLNVNAAAAPVVQANIPASNGVIHAIGQVLFP